METKGTRGEATTAIHKENINHKIAETSPKTNSYRFFSMRLKVTGKILIL